MSLDKPVVCPVLIGRGPQLEQLARAVDGIRAGRGQTLLVTGEAGIGKSRLVAEAKADTERLGLLVLQGHCFESDRSLPYAPLLDLLRTYLAQCPPEEIALRLGGAAAELVKILPDLSALLPTVTPTTPLDAEQEKRRIFQALTQVFAQVAGNQPLLVIVEDVHWSDGTSLEFLRYLARVIAAQPALLLLTYRQDETPPPLRHLLTEFDRERLAAELRLAPLSVDEIDTMIRAIFNLHRPVPAEFLTIISSLTEGNPFFIEETLRSMIAAGDIFYTAGGWNRKVISELRIPRTVQEAVRSRTAVLGTAARDTLVLAAVAGRRFDFALLQHVAQQDERHLLEAIKELIAVQLVVEESDERFAFRHALTRQAVYTELLARERKGLHRMIAEAIENLYAASLDAHRADLAYHFYEAGVWEKALEYAHVAGEQARALYASGAAIEHFTRALEAAGQLDRTPPSELYRARGLAYETLGEFERSQVDLETALGLARSAKARAAEWQAQLDLGFLWAGRDYTQAGDHFQQALALARSMGEPRTLAHSLNRIGNWLVNVGQAAKGLLAHQEALGIFQAEQDTQGTAETLDLLGMANGIVGDVATGARHYGRAIELQRALGDQQGLVSSLASRAVYASPALVEPTVSALGQPDDCARDTAEALHLARQIGSLAGQAYAEWTAGAACAAFGEFGAGLVHAQQSLRISTEIEHQQWRTAAYFTLGQTYLLMLESARAIEALEAGLRLAREVGSAWWIGNITASLTLARLLHHDLSGAQAQLQAVISREQRPHNLPERRMAWAWGELALAQGDPAAALRRADELLASAPAIGAGQYIPALLHLRGAALIDLNRLDQAEGALEAAKLGALERRARPGLWRIQLALGRLHHLSGREDQAQYEVAAARGTVEALATAIDDAALRQHFLRAALGALPPIKAPSPRRAEVEKFQGLTEREREVAALVGQGMSNRAIAETLVVGERTAEAHVSNILAKLGFMSRAQIAIWAAERGLVNRAE